MNDPAADPSKKPPAAGSEDFEEKYLRACADLDNYRKQVEKDKLNFAKFANEQTLAELLPVLDNFKRAAEHFPAELRKNEWAEGVAAIEQQFEQTLAGLGLRKIEVKVGAEYDAARHEVIGTDEGARGKILEIVEAGYELNGKILRAAKVRVGA